MFNTASPRSRGELAGLTMSIQPTIPTAAVEAYMPHVFQAATMTPKPQLADSQNSDVNDQTADLVKTLERLWKPEDGEKQEMMEEMCLIGPQPHPPGSPLRPQGDYKIKKTQRSSPPSSSATTSTAFRTPSGNGSRLHKNLMSPGEVAQVVEISQTA